MLSLENNQVQELPKFLLNLKLPIYYLTGEGKKGGIYLKNNPLEIPPVPTVKKGNKAIGDFLEKAEKIKELEEKRLKEEREIEEKRLEEEAVETLIENAPTELSELNEKVKVPSFVLASIVPRSCPLVGFSSIVVAKFNRDIVPLTSLSLTVIIALSLTSPLVAVTADVKVGISLKIK